MTRRNTILLLAILLLTIGKVSAQVFWFENWTGTACASLCTTYTGPNGPWTTVATGANGASANVWYYSRTEQAMGRGQCGTAAGTKATAHIGNVSTSPAAALFCPTGDCGAAYDASSGGDNTNTEIESPVINCTGKTGITLSFNYIMGGQATIDYASVNYYNGATWALLVNPPITATCAGGQGKWTYYSIALPASANNNANVQIAFNWQNNADNSGNDPSFAVDSIQLAVVVPTKPVANFIASDSTICVGDTVYFTDKSTNSPTSWKWTFTGGTPPTSIIQNPKVVYTSPGAFTVKLVVKNASGSDSLTKVSYINVVAKPTVTLSGNTTICSGSSTTITATGGGTYTWTPATNLTCTNCPNPTANPAATTTYSLAVSNGTCVKDTTITITVNPTPTVSVSPSSATICSSGGGATLTGSGASTYTWKPATGLTCTNCAVTTATPASTTTYTLVGVSAAGCKDSVTVVVTVASSITAVITGKDSVCKGSSTTLTASGGATYTWAPATGLNATNTAVVTATPASTTTYTVTATSGSCSAKDSVVVKVNPLPVVTLSAAPSLSICNGSSATLTATGGGTYLWTTTATTAGITVSPASTTTYSVTVKNASGCQVDTSMTVTVNPIPTVTVSPTSASICAGGGGASLTAGGASTYTWKPATGLSCTNCATTNANPASTTTYTVVGTSAAGCKDSTTVTVTVTGSISVTISGKDSVCAGGSTIITTSGGTTYSWSPATGLNCTNCSVTTVTPASTTTYTISVTNASGCNKDTTVVITVTPIPVVSIAPANPAICKGNSISLIASGAATYAWSPATGLTCTSCTNPTANPTTTTTYTVIGKTGGCVDTAKVTVTVDTMPKPGITGPQPICQGTSVPLNATGGSSYSWSPTGGLSCTSCPNPTASPASSVEYVVTISNGACSTKDSVSIAVSPSPFVMITNSNPITITSGQQVILNSTPSTSYSWTPATGLSCTNCPDPIASPTVTTMYYLTVTDTTDGCTAKDSILVIVKENCGDVFVPDAFAPNNTNGANEFLYVRGNCIQTLDFVIFDRWGNRVFETTDQTVPWDGTFKGKPMNTGTYAYYLQASTIDKQTITKQGNITLVR